MDDVDGAWVQPSSLGVDDWGIKICGWFGSFWHVWLEYHQVLKGFHLKPQLKNVHDDHGRVKTWLRLCQCVSNILSLSKCQTLGPTGFSDYHSKPCPFFWLHKFEFIYDVWPLSCLFFLGFVFWMVNIPVLRFKLVQIHISSGWKACLMVESPVWCRIWIHPNMVLHPAKIFPKKIFSGT